MFRLLSDTVIYGYDATQGDIRAAGAFSDGLLAIIITIMVLELKVPHESSAHALIEMWPTFFSYALRYLFVGAVWINHHHLIRFMERAEPGVIWANLSLLFFVSLIPFFTAYMAEKMDSFTTRLREMDRAGRKRNWIAFVAYVAAAATAYIHPWVSLAIVIGASAMYFVPDAKKKEPA